MDDQQFHQLLKFYSLSWSGYRKVRKGVKKRVRRHMQSLGYDRVTDYIQLLSEDDDARRQCERLMSVSISRFFRDFRLWQIFEQHLLPDILGQHGHLCVWSAGCASGEEIYSFKIICEQLRSSQFRLPEIELLATDYNPQCLDRAKVGIYTAGSLKDVPQKLLGKYFHRLRGDKRFQIDHNLKTGIVWQQHHLLSKPPSAVHDIIFLRNNLMTYYSSDIKVAALKPILSCLAPDGLLIIGAHERLPFRSRELKMVTPFSYVFQKKTAL